MGARRPRPRSETVGINLTAAQKDFIEEEAFKRDVSVSQLLRPGIVLALTMHFMGITLDEAVSRLLRNEVQLEDLVKYVNHQDEERPSINLYRPLRPQR